MRLIAVRHGQTIWNVEGREMGQLDSPLTPLGLEQAQRLAGRLSRMKIDAVYSSHLKRAMETAAIIAAACHTGVTPEPELQERHMGIFQGLTQAEMGKQFPSESRAYLDDQDFAIPGGESGPQRAERAMRAFTAIAERHADQTVVAVTHSGILRGALERVLAVPPSHGGRFRRQNASYNAFDYDARRWMLVTWNDTSHLEG